MKGNSLAIILCGVVILQSLYPNQMFNNAIISGVILDPDEMNYLVFLASVYAEKQYPRDPRVRACAGTLIHPNWVLSAAHCFYDKKGNFIGPNDWVASFGSVYIGKTAQGLNVDISNFVNNNKPWLRVQRRIRQIFLYPLYKMNDYTTHDIALLQLQSPVPIDNRYIGIMPLPYENFDPIGLKCNCGGWGCQFYGGDISLLASRGTFFVNMNYYCRDLEGNMTDRKICAGGTHGVYSICQGDSGSGLVCGVNGKAELIGVASYSSKADPQGMPNVFTRVGAYLDWLKMTMDVY